MRGSLIAIAAALTAVSAHAEAPLNLLPDPTATSVTTGLPDYVQCVPVARMVSGIQIYGDAYTWWDQAQGRYARGHTPQVGAVMAFRAHGNMKLGHVAAVTGVLDNRTVLLTHANWSPIDGRRGQIEHNVRAVDVSPDNDWSQVRVWYEPLGDLGTTAWPVSGFIYPQRDAGDYLQRNGGTTLLSARHPAPTAAPAAPRDVIGDIIRAAG